MVTCNGFASVRFYLIMTEYYYQTTIQYALVLQEIAPEKLIISIPE